MKIAFILTNYPSSGATFITNQITGMINLGHDVRIFALAPQKKLKKIHEDIIEYKLLDRLEYHGKPSSRKKEISILLSDMVKSPLQFSNRLLHSLNYKQFNKRSLTLAAYFLLRTYDKYKDFDIVNPHLGPVGINSLFLKDIYPDIKFITHFHGFDFTSRVRSNGSNLYDEVFRKADLITTQSYYSRNCLISIGCPPEKIIKHPLGVDLKRFNFQKRELKGNEKKRLVIVARLVEKKGHRFLLSAFSKILKKRDDIELHIVGDGVLRKEIENQINADVNLKRNVYMYGFRTQNEVRDILDNCHIFVHPSITAMRWAEQEDTTIALLEAQAKGLPVISTFHAGIPEVVIHKETGFLVPERSENDLINTIETLCNHPETWEDIGTKGHEFVENKFDIKKLNLKLEWIFKTLKSLKGNESLGIKSSEEITL
jgi:colanic acid/amylovoran biosynthesis glycosyltransferase